MNEQQQPDPSHGRIVRKDRFHAGWPVRCRAERVKFGRRDPDNLPEEQNERLLFLIVVTQGFHFIEHVLVVGLVVANR